MSPSMEFEDDEDEDDVSDPEYDQEDVEEASSCTTAAVVSAGINTVKTLDRQFRSESYHQDSITCGVCHKVFALSDIIKFIRHKVKQCFPMESRQHMTGHGTLESTPTDVSTTGQGNHHQERKKDEGRALCNVT